MSALKFTPILKSFRPSISKVLIVDLLQSILRCSIQLELHYINELIRLENKVDATLTGMIFDLNIEADQFEYDEKDILVMQIRKITT